MLSQIAIRVERLSQRWLASVPSHPAGALAILLVITALSALPGQTIVPAVDRTEGVVALSSRHVAETGRIFDPRWGDNVQTFRPAGTFWVQAALLRLQGDAAATDVTAYRRASFIATVLAAGLLFWLGRGLFGAETAFLAALGVAVTPIVQLHGQLAIAEPLVLPAIIVSQFALFVMYRDGPDAPPPRWLGWRGLFWVVLGVSTWFNALAVVLLAVTTIAGLAVADRSFDLIRRIAPLTGSAIFIVAAAPWLISLWLIGDGAPFAGLDWRRVLDVLEGGQAMKFKTVYGVFVLFVAVLFIPVSHMLGPAVQRAWVARRDPAVRFLLVWLIVPVIVLELFSNKPPLYTVQAVFPAGALLVALAVTGRLGQPAPFKAWPGTFWAASLIVVGAVSLLTAGLLWLTATPPTPSVIAGALAIMVLFIVAGWAAARGEARGWFLTAIAATAVLDLWFFGALMPGLRNTWTAPQLRRAVDEVRACGIGDIVISGFNEPSLPLAIGRSAAIMTADAAGTRLAQAPEAWAIIEARRRTAFDKARSAAVGGGGAAALTARGCVRAINMARGCQLRFEILAPADGAQCRLSVPPTCPPTGGARHWLEIKHCR